MSKPSIYPVHLLSWLAKNGTRCILLQTSLKHTVRQFGLYDPPTDLIQITECGPDMLIFLFQHFSRHRLFKARKVCNIRLVTYNIRQQRGKNLTKLETMNLYNNYVIQGTQYSERCV